MYPNNNSISDEEALRRANAMHPDHQRELSDKDAWQRIHGGNIVKDLESRVNILADRFKPIERIRK